MKKFDVLIVFIAICLLGFGYHFSVKFRKDENVQTKSQSGLPEGRPRIPSSQKNGEDSHVSSEEPEQGAQNKKLQQRYIAYFMKIKKCISSGSCPFSQEDPRAYEFEAYSRMNKHLKKIGLLDQKQKEALLKLAAKEKSGHVKETVLNEVMKEGFYSTEWRDLLLKEYISFHDPTLVPGVIEYFKKYSSNSDLQIIHEHFFQEITQGSPKVANALAENLKSLLDEKSLSFYKNQLTQLQEGPIKKNLSRQIKAYELMVSAG